MKIQKLKEIIREEVKKALRKENGTETAPAKPGTAPVKPGTAQPSKPQPRRKIGREDIPKESPIPVKASSLKETEKELANKITQRFLKLKK